MTARELPMREKQLVACMRQGRQLTFSILDEEFVYGYLAGWDAETYFILQPTPRPGTSDKSRGVDKLLIPKANILFIQMGDEKIYRDEPQFEEMERIIKPFRDKINNDYPPKDR